MDFDLSKENIQPLRGGRNAHQLGIALQAQSSEEIQRELESQRAKYEEAIRTYEGEDPLDNWYDYIVWVEQCYPKHGPEGNLQPILEDCIGKFENIEKYHNDRRLCKIFIKYFDMNVKPLEGYHMLYSKQMFLGCADLYKAWAFYYEAAGDFKNAKKVFLLGKDQLAQPYDELEQAYDNMIYHAGQQATGLGQMNLDERRHALTSLKSTLSGKVGIVRVGSSRAAPIGGAATTSRSNQQIKVFSDEKFDILGAGAAPVSILQVVKSDEAPKENVMNPGTWTSAYPMKRPHAHTNAAFKVHDDSEDLPQQAGLRLPEGFVDKTLADFSDWTSTLCFVDPENPCVIPMYPKDKVYRKMYKNIEFSIEEIRARRYLKKRDSRLLVPVQETQQAVESILGNNVQQPMEDEGAVGYDYNQMGCTGFGALAATAKNDNVFGQDLQYQSTSYDHQQNLSYRSFNQNLHINLPHQSNNQHEEQLQHDAQSFQQRNNSLLQSRLMQQPYNSPIQNQYVHTPQHVQNQSIQNSPQYVQNTPLHLPNTSQHITSPQIQNNSQHMQNYPGSVHTTPQAQQVQNCLSNTPQNRFQHVQNVSHPFLSPTGNLQSVAQVQSPQQNQFQFSVLNSPVSNTTIHASFQVPERPVLQSPVQPNMTFQNSMTQRHVQSVHENFPSVDLTVGDDDEEIMNEILWVSATEDCNETPAIVKPSAHQFNIFEDGQYIGKPKEVGNAMKTPFKTISHDDLAETGSRGGLDHAAAAQPSDGAKRLPIFEDDSDSYDAPCAEYADLNSTNTIAFNAHLNDLKVSTPQKRHQTPAKALSVIFEETKSGSSSSENHSTRPTISEEESRYQYNLAQNMKVNEQLRLSLMGDIMECETQPSSPVIEVPAPKPISFIPSDPWNRDLINMLLQQVQFPGRHRSTYHYVQNVPRVVIKKESQVIGDASYIVEKLLGKGAFGSVYKATNCSNKQPVALKCQRTPSKWEYYICKEIRERLSLHPLQNCFMDVHAAYLNESASIFISEFCPFGSLLNLANKSKVKFNKPMKESWCTYFCFEMIVIMETLHKIKIIHADIKPDNFLVFIRGNELQLQLIDFGCSIDMALLPENAAFTRKVTTEDFICCEMRDDRPWNYHTDYFCIAATAHVLLFDKYITLQKTDGRWSLTQRFARYHHVDLWNTFFSSLLNMQDGLPDLDVLKDCLNTVPASGSDIRNMYNLVMDR